MAGGFDERSPTTCHERALRLSVSWPWVLLQLSALLVDSLEVLWPLRQGLEALWQPQEPSDLDVLRLLFLLLAL